MKILPGLIYLLFLVLPLGQLTRLPQFYPSVNLYLHDLIIAAIVLVWAAARLKKVKPPPLAQPIAVFVAAAFASLVFALFRHPPSQVLLGSLYLVRFILYAGLYWVFSDRPIRLLLASGLALVGLGLAQYLFFPDVRFLKASGWDDHFYRIVSTLFDPNFSGLIYVLTLTLLFFNRKKLKPLVFYPASIATFITLLLTYSRSSYLAFLAAAAAYGFVKRNFNPLLVAVSFLLLAVLILPRPGGEGVNLTRTFSVNQRLENYAEGFELFKSQPIFGVGFNLVRFERQSDPNWEVSHANAGFDSSLIFVMATTGLVGLAAYLNLLRHAFKISPLAKVALVAALTHSLFTNSLFYPWVMIWLWLILAFKSKAYS